jgi:hypothetical protein
MKRLILIFLIAVTTKIMFAQGGLTGSWKYSSPGGEMNMQIGSGTIVINNQTFPYKAQGNVLMINEGTVVSPYPYMLDGDLLSIEFPGGTEIVFTRVNAGSPTQGPLPQSMSKPSSGTGPGQQSSSLSGRWMFRNQQGQLNLEFISANQLSFNGETTQYQLKEGIIQAMGDYGWIDYPYELVNGTLTITFPDGTKIPFTRAATSSNQQNLNQQGTSRQSAGGGANWQLRGTLCSWSGSSNSSSGYSRTRKLVFDGQGNYQFGSEASFSSGAGIAYGGNPNVETGTYTVGESFVTLRNSSGESYQFKINMRQDSGMITELMFDGTLYATGLCE